MRRRDALAVGTHATLALRLTRNVLAFNELHADACRGSPVPGVGSLGNVGAFSGLPSRP